MTHFYEATATEQENFSRSKKFKVVVIGIGTTTFRRREKLEVNVMDRQAYKDSKKEGHLITFVVNDSNKQDLKNIFENNLGSFDKENPCNIFQVLGEDKFSFVEKTNIDHYLNDESFLLENIKSIEEKEIKYPIIKQRILDLAEFVEARKAGAENKFDEDGEISKQLAALKGELELHQGDDNNNGSGLEDINGLIEKVNKIDFNISLENLSAMLHDFEKLQPRFSKSEGNHIQKSIGAISSILTKYKNEKVTEKNATYLAAQEVVFLERITCYSNNFFELKKIVDTVAEQLSKLEPLLSEAGKVLLEKELFFDRKICEFHTNLPVKPLAELESNAAQITEAFNIKLDSVKKDFVKVSKQRLETVHGIVCRYSGVESAESILKEVASLQAMLVDFYPNNATQLALTIERVNKCIEDANAFSSRTFHTEGVKKTDLRSLCYSVGKFFDNKMLVLEKIKKHGEQIGKGSKLAHTKAGILGEIFAKANDIKGQHESLIKSDQLEPSQADKMQENITSLVKFIDDNKDTLSRYRGIYALKPLAKLWGGGKVTSMEYASEIANEIKGKMAEASKFNDSVSRVSLSSAP